MTVSKMEMRDTIHIARDMASALSDNSGIVGWGWVERFNGDGECDLIVPFANLITDTGDGYYAAMGIALVNPAAAAQPTKLTGMQIGSGGGTAAAKSGAGGAMVTLLAGQAFDATYPSVSNLGAGLGQNAVYKTTYAAGTGTGTVSEATLTNGTIGTASTAGNTIARTTFTGIVKGAADSLAITWNNKFLGA